MLAIGQSLDPPTPAPLGPTRPRSAQGPAVDHTGEVAWLRKHYFPIGIILGLAVITLGCLAGKTDTGEVNREGLEGVTPVNTAEAQFNRTRVIADLADGYQGTLKIDDVSIPTNQLEQADGLNRLMFVPGDGKVIGQLRPRENCAEVTYWPLGQSPAEGQSYRWCFNVV